MESVYETSFALRAPDTDFLGSWRPGAIFTAMQELGDVHSTILGVGFSTLRPAGVAWVLTRTLLEIGRAPSIGEKIVARTWPGRSRHAVYPRYYVFEDENGNPLAQASSLWVLMDIAAREMVTAKSRGIAAFSEGALPPPISNPGGIARLDGQPRVEERKVVFSDLDINRHVNNARYVDWLGDCFPCEWHEKNRIGRLLVHFVSETLPNESLRTLLTTQGLSFTFAGEREGQTHFAMGGDFLPR